MRSTYHASLRIRKQHRRTIGSQCPDHKPSGPRDKPIHLRQICPRNVPIDDHSDGAMHLMHRQNRRCRRHKPRSHPPPVLGHRRMIVMRSKSAIERRINPARHAPLPRKASMPHPRHVPQTLRRDRVHPQCLSQRPHLPIKNVIPAKAGIQSTLNWARPLPAATQSTCHPRARREDPSRNELRCQLPGTPPTASPKSHRVQGTSPYART